MALAGKREFDDQDGSILVPHILLDMIDVGTRQQ